MNLPNRNRLIDSENKLMVAKGKAPLESRDDHGHTATL